MKNDQSCEIEDVRSVKIHLFDEIKLTFIQIWFICDMQKNMSSLGMLDSQKFEWSSNKDVLEVRVLDKSIISVHSHNNLYLLNHQIQLVKLMKIMIYELIYPFLEIMSLT